jgi:membrane protease YdiL (CAAX protease family)
VIPKTPVTSFLLIAFGVSYGLGIPFNAMVAPFFDPQSLPGLYLPRAVTVVGPAVAAVLVASGGRGVVSIRQLLGSLRPRTAQFSWIAACAMVGFMSAAIAFLLAGLPLEQLLEVVANRAPLLFGHVLIQVTLIGVGEELGWRGWLLPNLAAHRSFAAATALTALAWGLWHMPLFFSAVPIALSLAVLLASLSVAFSWLWHHTGGNTGVVALAHGLINAPIFFLEQIVRPMAGGNGTAVRAFTYFAACCSAVAVALCITRRDIWRRRRATESSPDASR